MTSTATHHPSSYRDPSGFVFEKEGTLYRQVNVVFKDHFDFFIKSGLYNHLTEKGLLVTHEQLDQNFTNNTSWHATLKPEKISFISYPYEWSFDMLKDAALLTLGILRESLQFGMVLKDATPFNIQWHKGKLIFIDTLSFEKYNDTPWIAYRQFCESFLGPLLLMKYSKKELSPLLLSWPDGVPLDIVQSLLPWRSRFSLHTYLHIYLQNKISSKQKTRTASQPTFSKDKLLRLVSSLEILINRLSIPKQKSTWQNYYEEASQRNDYLDQKSSIISAWVDEMKFLKTAVDLGANEGHFSRLIAGKNISVLATDFDPYCINTLYTAIKSSGEKNIQPLIQDLANPTPSIGVNNEERSSFINRVKTDLALALALIHHLAIGKNIPFEKIASFFSGMSEYLIIEFVPKEDEKIKLMLSRKEDIYTSYTEENFVAAFSTYFSIEKKQAISGSLRTLYLMKRR